MKDVINLTPAQQEMLEHLSKVPGADVWDFLDAKTGRELQDLKLTRIVKARHAPKDGAMRQPYYGIKITAAGRKLLGRPA